VALVGTLRAADGSAGRSSAVGLRTARRVLGIAEELGLPVVTVVDTTGAVIGSQAERQGIAGEIARSIDAWTSTPVPTLAVLAGSGCGGGALAWMPADRIIAADDAWLAPIAPEAASLIIHRDTDHASQMADAQGIDASTLAGAAVIDELYPVDSLATAVIAEVASLGGARPHDRPARFARLAASVD
jgi:acetyl-CoA carboxylase carboxyl transferase subunit beta